MVEPSADNCKLNILKMFSSFSSFRCLIISAMLDMELLICWKSVHIRVYFGNTCRDKTLQLARLTDFPVLVLLKMNIGFMIYGIIGIEIFLLSDFQIADICY